MRAGALCIALIMVAGPAVAAEWARYAIVVGYNGSDDSDLAPLKYADDDAVKHAELMRRFTDETVLLAELDPETRRVHGTVKASSPTRANIMAALTRMQEKMAAAKKAGKKPMLYFVYSGHGNYDQEGRGYVHLKDGRFTTRDMYFNVLGPTASDDSHHLVLMVDACNAALLVNSRGGNDRRRARRTSLKLEDYPNVGVVLSASSVGEVHEWGKYLSGIFSHELRSAMMGPADLNDDGEVSFPELAAFIASANAEVKNEIYRIKPYIRPPLSAPNMPLVSLNDARFRAKVRIPAAFSGKAHLVNNELLRYADFHKARGEAFWLGVPTGAPFVLVHGKAEYVIDAQSRGELQLSELKRREQSDLSSRGTDMYFETRLFARAHAPAPAREWIKKEYAKSLIVQRFDPVPWYDNVGAWTLAGTSLASLSVAVGLNVAALNLVDGVQPTDWYDDVARVRQTADTYRQTAWAMYAVSGAAAISSVLWFALDNRFRRSDYHPPLEVDVLPGGVQLRSRF